MKDVSHDFSSLNQATLFNCDYAKLTCIFPVYKDGENLAIKLIQKYGLKPEVAEHLATTYGGQAWTVCDTSQANQTGFGALIAPGYPYIEEEVLYACKEYACTIEDILSRRTRLAFLNKEAALGAVPKVAELMSKELGWDKAVTEKQIEAAIKYVESYSGSA